MQQKRQSDCGGELRAGRQRVRSLSKQCISAITGEHERDVVATCHTSAAGTVRVVEVNGFTPLAAIVAAIVTASVVGHRVHRQRHHVR